MVLMDGWGEGIIQYIVVQCACLLGFIFVKFGISMRGFQNVSMVYGWCQ